MSFRSRVTATKLVKAGELKPSRWNYRTHGDGQRTAFRAVLEEIGFAGSVLAFTNDEGRLELIDGHLRLEETPADEKIPVVVTDLTADEAKKLLAVYDPISALAEADATLLNELRSSIEFDSRDLELLLDSIEGVERHDDDGAEGERGKAKDRSSRFPEMELQPHEHYDYVVVVCRRRNDWHRLLALLNLEHVRKPRTKKIGLGRAVEVDRLLELIDGKVPDRDPVAEALRAGEEGPQPDPDSDGVRRRARGKRVSRRAGS